MTRNLSQWLDYQSGLHPAVMDFGLGRMHEMLNRLGLRRGAERVITVGGTNGKGSVSAMLDAILRAAGWRTGLYTSPHLVDLGAPDESRRVVRGVDLGAFGIDPERALYG